MARTLLVIAAHSDSAVVGAGGTLAAYAKAGWVVKMLVMAYGERTHPHIKREEVIKMKQKEAKQAEHILGGSGIIWLGIPDSELKKMSVNALAEKILPVLKQEKPALIFTHSKDDIHTSHRSLFKTVKKLKDMKAFDCPAWTFDVWTPFGFLHGGEPKMLVDTTQTLQRKIRAFFCYQSEFVLMFTAVWSIYIRSILHGRRNRTRYAEVLYLMN